MDQEAQVRTCAGVEKGLVPKPSGSEKSVRADARLWILRLDGEAEKERRDIVVRLGIRVVDMAEQLLQVILGELVGYCWRMKRSQYLSN